ncbi:hypothetical protein ACLB2K_058797 [Fragaria x ananassa]
MRRTPPVRRPVAARRRWKHRFPFPGECGQRCSECIILFARLQSSKNILLDLEKEEVKEEAEAEVVVEEEEENKEGEDEAEEDEEFEMCDVCLKDKNHWTDECPYLVYIPNPMEVTLGKGYDIVCLRCNVFGGHSDVAGMDCKVCGGNPNGRWVGRAKIKYCFICKHYDHRYVDCLKKYLLET